jgi:hypothetical protein
MLASARGRQGSTAAKVRARKRTASVARGAEIPMTILELKSSNIWGGVERLMENLKNLRYLVSIFDVIFTDK